MMTIMLIFYLFCSVSAFGLETPLSTKEKLTGYLADLAAMNTETSNQEANLTAMKWVEKQLSPLKLEAKYYEFGGYHSLIISTKKTKKLDILLVAHMDVVPAPEALFKSKIENNRMYGRGVYDMKMAIACYILLMHELKDQLDQLNIGIMLTSDEEVGGMNGVRCLLNEGYTSNVVLLPDGGFNWNFEEAAKGVLHVKVIAKGKAAHSSRPWLGDNAINELIVALHDIKDYFDQQKIGGYYPTANLGLIDGGKSTNQVPDYAEAKIDIRFPPSMNANEIFAKLQELTEKKPSIIVEEIIRGSSSKADLTNPYFQKFQAIAKGMYGIDVGSTFSHGSSDARFFGEKNIPVLVVTSKGGDIHGDGEWVDLEDLVRFYEVMKRWVIQ